MPRTLALGRQRQEDGYKFLVFTVSSVSVGCVVGRGGEVFSVHDKS